MTTVAEPLGRNLTYGLLEQLGRAIVGGAYVGRGFPTEAELTEQHGVSRSVTREAVKMLTAKGLLGARPKQGTFVMPEKSWHLFDEDVLRWMLERKTSIELMRQYNELRLGIEPQAAALAAMRRDPVSLERIADGLARMERAERREEDPVEADVAFHSAVLVAAGNPFFLQFRQMVATSLASSIRLTNRISGHTASIADHEAVYKAIKAGNPNRAAKAMKKLIDEVSALLETIKE